MTGLRIRYATFWAVCIATLLVSIELACFVVTRLRPDLFDEREQFLDGLRLAEFDRAKTTTASNLLGWDNPASTTVRTTNCAGDEVVATFNADRNRPHGKRAPGDAVILIAGDSYTVGNAVGDEDTYPAELERILKVPTANLGVSGYGPDQALLKLEQQIERFPRAQIAVLSILYDDTARMLNSFRPLLQRPTGRGFGLKPFVADGRFHGIIGANPYQDLDAFKAAVLSAYDEDFWRRRRATFPYAASVAGMMSLPSFWIPALTQLTEYLGRPHYDVLHRIPSVRSSLRALYDRFGEWTRKRGLRGIVVFIPVDDRDRTSGLAAIAAATRAQRQALTFHNVTTGDGSTYRQKDWCHPSAAGYRTIATNVAEAIRPFVAR
jgi:hypothetical protein